MMRPICLASLLLAALSGGGCCSDRVYRDTDGCATAHLPGTVDVAHAGHCSACGPSVAGNCDRFRLKPHLRNLLTCGAGCGEIYWGEWINDPPAPCDPCDHYGHWVGPRPTCDDWFDLALPPLSGRYDDPHHRVGTHVAGCTRCDGYESHVVDRPQQASPAIAQQRVHARPISQATPVRRPEVARQTR